MTQIPRWAAIATTSVKSSGDITAPEGFDAAFLAAIGVRTTVAALGDVADLVSAAFELDRDWVGRTFCSSALLPARAVSFFLASKDGEPYSAVTTTASGADVGIWSMATSPNHLRQGAGRAVLLAAIEHHRGLGATTFYLIATPSGKPLYDSLGFKTVDEFPMWVKG